jgi:hypothetical protein
MILFITTAVKTSNPTRRKIFGFENQREFFNRLTCNRLNRPKNASELALTYMTRSFIYFLINESTETLNDVLRG